MNLLTDATQIDQPAVTVFTSDTRLLCKQFSTAPNGATIKTTHATFSRGRAAHVHTRTPQDLETLLDALDHNQAISIGTLRDGRRETGVTTKSRPVLGAVSRSKEYFHFPPDEPGWMLWDYDTGSMPDAVRTRVTDLTIAGMSILCGPTRLVRGSSGVREVATGSRARGTAISRCGLRVKFRPHWTHCRIWHG